MASTKGAPGVAVQHNAAHGFYELGAEIDGVFVVFARVPDNVVAQALADAKDEPQDDTESEGGDDS